MIRSAAGILALRAVLAATSFVVNVLVTRLIIEAYGADEFAAISLLASIPALIPFGDLGMGTSVINSASDLKHGEKEQAARRMRAAQFVLFCMSGVLLSVALVLLATNAWPGMLGPASRAIPNVSLAATVIVACIAINVSLSIATRSLQGWRRIPLTLAISLVTAPMTLGFTLLFINVFDSAALTATAAALALLITGALFWVPVLRDREVSVTRAMRSARLDRSAVKYVLHVGFSGLVVATATALVLQSDRLILSFGANASDLAQYAVVVPLFFALWAFLTPLAISMWPLFRVKLAAGELTAKMLGQSVLLTGSVGGVCGAGLFIAGPAVAHLMSGGTIDPPLGLYLAFSVLLLVAGVQLPGSMVLNSQRGFVTQRNAALAMVPVKLIGALALVPVLGASGAVLASVAAIAVVQLPWTTVAAVRAIRRSRVVRSLDVSEEVSA